MVEAFFFNMVVFFAVTGMGCSTFRIDVLYFLFTTAICMESHVLYGTLSFFLQRNQKRHATRLSFGAIARPEEHPKSLSFSIVVVELSRM